MRCRTCSRRFGDERRAESEIRNPKSPFSTQISTLTFQSPHVPFSPPSLSGLRSPLSGLPSLIVLTTPDLTLIESRLADPIWRLTSGQLYKIAPADGTGLQPFRPRPEQTAIIRAIHGEGKKRILIPKARRLGISTVLAIILLDLAIWNRERQCSLIDQNQADATRKLDRIMRVALDNLPEWLMSRLRIPKSNGSQLSIALGSTGASTIYAGMNARGGSNDALWISEWGVIQHEDPKRSSKIRSGALPSARHGLTVVETTWAGGKGGDVWDLLEPTLTGKADDWQVMFFPWWIDPRNVSNSAMIDSEADAYFTRIAPRLERDGVVLTEPQRRWWAAERRAQGIFMARENPTFLDECWTVPVSGAVYAEAIERARTEGRICQMPVDGSNLVHTSWDLGSPVNTVVWYWQVVGREIRFIDCDRGDKGTLTERVAQMLAKGYNYGKHFLPHDCAQTERSGTTFLSELARAGLPASTLVPVPRTHSVWLGINHALEMFPALAFRAPHCDAGLDALMAYRTRPQGEGPQQVDEPIHDWSSHPADAFRLMAEAHRAGLIAFKHTAAEPKPEWYGNDARKRRGMKEVRVSGEGSQ